MTRERADAEPREIPLYVGTSGWAYTIWKPDFYPKEVSSKNFLKYYATQLTAVEVNYTFRRQLSEKAATGWMADVGPNFRFALKANQYITHIRRLQNVEEAMQRFLAHAATAGDATGAGAVSVAAYRQGGCRRAAGFPGAAADELQGCIRIPSPVVVQRRDLQALQDRNATLCVAETEKLEYARGPHGQLHLFSLSPAQLLG